MMGRGSLLFEELKRFENYMEWETRTCKSTSPLKNGKSSSE